MRKGWGTVTEAGGFGRFWLRVTACHVLTYMVAGFLAFWLLRYPALFDAPELAGFMRPMNSKWVAAGPALQVVRGFVIAAALYRFRASFLNARHGWLALAGLLIGLSALSASGAAPGSFEGVIYTRLSLPQHLRGLPEVLLQNVAFAALLCGWYRSPSRWWNPLLWGGAGLSILLSLAGVFAAK